MNKPTKNFTNFLPNGFGTADGVVKNDFSSTKKENGFSTQVEDIFAGENINYMLDTIGKQLKYLTDVVDYLVSIPSGNVPYINGNDMTSATIHTLLPSQTDNAGKFLTTNGANSLSWAASVTDIGDPLFTLNFNKTLPENYIWLDGQELNVADYEDLFAIYGYAYSNYNSGTKFKVPNFNNCTIWGGTTAGKVEAGLPNLVGWFQGAAQGDGYCDNRLFTKRGTGAKVKNDGEKDNTYDFNAHNYNAIYGNSSTVQPPAIKVRAYTRAK